MKKEDTFFDSDNIIYKAAFRELGLEFSEDQSVVIASAIVEAIAEYDSMKEQAND